MKKVTSLLLLAGVAAFGLVGCGDDVSVTQPQAEITSVAVTPAEVSVEPGQTATVTANVQTSGDAGQLSYSWSVADANVATVSGSGSSATITGQSSGTTAVQVEVTAANVSGAATASTGVTVEELEPATVSVASVEDAAGNPIDPDDVSGQILVTINVEEGDRTIEAVQVLFNDQVAAEQTFSSANVVATKKIKGQGEVSQLEFSINTARAAGALDGNPVQGEFSNGPTTVSGRLQLANVDQSPTAEYNETLNFNNSNSVLITRFEGGNTAVEDSEGVPYVGGTDVTYAATPILFSDITVGSVTVSASTDGPQLVAFDASGSGAVTMSSAPFRFLIVADDNSGVEDAPIDNGHVFETTEVRNDANVNVTTSFLRPAGGDRLDFTAPTLADPLEIFNTVFSPFVGPFGSPGSGEFWVGTSTSEWSLPNASDGGVGGVTPNVAVTTATGDTVGTNQTHLGQLDESEFDYIAGVVSAQDKLGNTAVNDGDVSDVGGPDGFAIDKGSPEIEDALPEDDLVLNGAINDPDHNLLWSASDPDLADNTAGSGVATAYVLITSEGDTLETTASPTSGDYDVDAFGAGFGDGEYVVTVVTPDAAIDNFASSGAFNVATHQFSFLMDTSAPSFSGLQPPTGTSTGATSVIQSFAGTVSDLSTIVNAEITVRADGDDAQGTNQNGTCETTDYLLSPGAGEIDQNSVDITNGMKEIDFEESFEISDPFSSGSGTVTYCYLVEAEDSATDNDGTAEHNVGSVQTNADIEWTN